jgi:hypothetical protein
MNYSVKLQDSYSRGELLLRAFFGAFYIGIPHAFVILFLAIGFIFVRIASFWVILITGKYPRGLFDYQVKFMRYQLRVNARFSNLADGYPEFGLNGKDEHTEFDIPYTEEISRGTLLIRTLFGGIYVSIPHGFVLFFRMIATMFLQVIAFWIILFTGKFPKDMFEFIVGTGRWQYRVNAYLLFYTDEYPAFSGKVLPGENNGQGGSSQSGMSDVLDSGQ